VVHCDTAILWFVGDKLNIVRFFFFFLIQYICTACITAVTLISINLSSCYICLRPLSPCTHLFSAILNTREVGTDVKNQMYTYNVHSVIIKNFCCAFITRYEAKGQKVNSVKMKVLCGCTKRDKIGEKG